MDELAHSNAPGSRHPKRWQDIEELLEAGIDVFTTVNVQHLESLNDVVSGVTGIQVRETVPDPFFDAADDVVLVDLPPGRSAPAAERRQSLYCRAGGARH
ncbi:two-component sensor kinase [Escherichia coli]|uniref:Two-component sensor kinase n=1 Tax=Escherichia coli TaxID=562 RepID=A0A376LKW9_ECOLX|nr:two-component sensor kinase [Escherichia coli]